MAAVEGAAAGAALPGLVKLIKLKAGRGNKPVQAKQV
jgi:hypothetical protein